MLILLVEGGRLGRTSATVSCILETAAAHAECFFEADENFRFAGRKWPVSSCVQQRGQMKGVEEDEGTRRALDSRKIRALILVDRIEGGRCEG